MKSHPGKKISYLLPGGGSLQRQEIFREFVEGYERIKEINPTSSGMFRDSTIVTALIESTGRTPFPYRCSWVIERDFKSDENQRQTCMLQSFQYLETLCILIYGCMRVIDAICAYGDRKMSAYFGDASCQFQGTGEIIAKKILICKGEIIATTFFQFPNSMLLWYRSAGDFNNLYVPGVLVQKVHLPYWHPLLDSTREK